MRFVIKKTQDIELIKQLHLKAFPKDDFYNHPKSHYWLLICHYETKPFEYAGFSMLTDFNHKICFLSRAAVFTEYSGKGLHLRLIKHRLAYAKRAGFEKAITYTSPRNVKSSRNLISAGFELYDPEELWVGRDFNYFLKVL